MRVKLSRAKLSPSEREALQVKLASQLFNGEISEGDMLRQFRTTVFGLTQSQFAKLAGVSRSLISDVELGKQNQTLLILNKVFDLAGFKFALIPKSRDIIESVFTQSGDS